MILAIWGSSYVWSCVLVLSAPGRAVEFKYKSKSGTLVLRADSYAVDWDHGTAHIDHPRIYGPDGAEMVSASTVDAVGVQLPPFNSVIVKVRDAKGKLTRLASGRFEVQDFLPEQKGPPSQLPFSVNVNRAEITLTDLAGAKPFQRFAIANNIEVRGVGDQWLANASVNVVGIGHLDAEIQSLPNEGILVRGNTPGLQLGPLLEHLKTTPESKSASFLKELQASSLEAIGPVSFYLPKEKGAQIETRIKAVAKNFRFRDYAADQAFFDGEVSETSAKGQLDARYGPTKAKFHGSLVYADEIAVGGQLVVDSPSSSSLPQWLRKMIPADISFSGAHADAWLDYRKQEGVRLEGKVGASSATVYGQRVDQPKLAMTAGTDELRIGVESAKWGGTPLKGAVLVGIKTPALTGAVTANAVDLGMVGSRFGAKGLSGKAQVSLLLGGTRTNPTAMLQASGNGSYRIAGKLVTGRFQAAGNYAKDLVRVDRFRVGTDAGSARAIGTFSLKRKTLALKVDATNLRLEKLRKDLIGNINASGLVAGTFSNPRFNGHALALGVQAGGQEIPFISSKISADKNRLLATDLQVVKGTGEARGSVALNFKNHGLSGNLSAENVLINEYLGNEALGTVTVPNVTIGGTVSNPRIAGTAYGDDLLLGGIRVDHAEIASTLKGTIANVESLSAKIGEGTITGTGNYDYSKKVGTFKAKATALALDRITPPGKGSANVTGSLSGDALVSISPSGTVRGKGNGSFQDVNLNSAEFGSGNWTLAYDGEDLTGNASIGKLDRFLLLENVDYNAKAET